MRAARPTFLAVPARRRCRGSQWIRRFWRVICEEDGCPTARHLRGRPPRPRHQHKELTDEDVWPVRHDRARAAACRVRAPRSMRFRWLVRRHDAGLRLLPRSRLPDPTTTAAKAASASPAPVPPPRGAGGNGGAGADGGAGGPAVDAGRLRHGGAAVDAGHSGMAAPARRRAGNPGRRTLGARRSRPARALAASAPRRRWVAQGGGDSQPPGDAGAPHACAARMDPAATPARRRSASSITTAA